MFQQNFFGDPPPIKGKNKGAAKGAPLAKPTPVSTPTPADEESAPAPKLTTEQQKLERERMAKMLEALNFDPGFCMAMMAMADVFGLLSAEETAYLRGPIMLHGRGPGWECPKRLRDVIPQARLRHILMHPDSREATSEEVLAVLSTASYEAPLMSEYVQIMAVLTCEVGTRYKWLNGEVMWKAMGEPKEPELSSYHNTVLQDLACSIRRSVVKHGARRSA